MAIEKRKDDKNRVLKYNEYQRANGTYEYKWTDRGGKRHSIYAKTLNELRGKEADLLRDILDGIRVNEKNITLNDLFRKWEVLKKSLSDNTFQNYKYMYKQFVASELGERQIGTIKKSDIRAFYNKLHDTDGLKVNTLDSVQSILHQVLQIAVDDGILRVNPSDDALKELKKAYRGEIKKKEALSYEEERIFFDFLLSTPMYYHWYSIFVTMAWTGMRVSEVCGLTWDDIDFENDEIHLNHRLVYYKKADGCSFVIHNDEDSNKNCTRLIPLLPIVKQVLKDEKEYQEELGIKSIDIIDGYHDFIFVNRFGNVQHQGTLNKALRRIIRDCNFKQLDEGGDIVPKFSCHILRHTFSTRMVEVNVNLKAMQAVLGHKDSTITLETYTDAQTPFVKREFKKLKRFFDGNTLTTDVRRIYDTYEEI